MSSTSAGTVAVAAYGPSRIPTAGGQRPAAGRRGARATWDQARRSRRAPIVGRANGFARRRRLRWPSVTAPRCALTSRSGVTQSAASPVIRCRSLPAHAAGLNATACRSPSCCHARRSDATAASSPAAQSSTCPSPTSPPRGDRSRLSFTSPATRKTTRWSGCSSRNIDLRALVSISGGFGRVM
ncbi:MAG: hypothetical protein QOK16_3224 [Solirubrobacteraceae bacterium]|nr:hypothetical protein [Solirubrobacteraceae bacterium]